ncbi:MAG: putative FAD-linked oxidoreductase [Promethearchaeota archaeon]|nr:MAG: putative FAD-linked oxidoreductase [Candidatus Lokiarchaeota archaeon]
MSLYDELVSIVGEKYCTDKDYICVAYSRGLDPCLPEIIPQIVLRPDSTEQVVEIVQVANKYTTSIVPRGGGCGLMGGSKPISKECIVVDLTRMDKILDIDEDNKTVTVQCGINWSRLNAVLFDKGYYTGNMGPGSGLNASIGGGLSHHSGGGGGCAKYGKCSENCVGLEVVLGTGKVITLGSQENIYVKKPFQRLGLGPDLMGIFLGDNGTMGVKTTATLKIFPKPPYFSGKTYLLEEKPYENTRDMVLEMMKKGWSKSLGIYDYFFTPPPSVLGIATDNLIKTWDNITGGVIFYVTEAFDERVLERNSELLEGIAKKYSTRELGPSVEEGNITDWFYGEQGHWQVYHSLLSLTSPDNFACTTEVMVPIAQLSKILHMLDEWEEEKIDDLFEADAFSGVSHVVMLPHNSCYIGGGLTASSDEDLKEDVIKLWKEQFELLLHHGAVLYMCGQIGSQVLVDSRIYNPQFYTFFTQIKDIVDPNHIISPGKFKF